MMISDGLNDNELKRMSNFPTDFDFFCNEYGMSIPSMKRREIQNSHYKCPLKTNKKATSLIQSLFTFLDILL